VSAAIRGLLDTSIFIADELGRRLDDEQLPDESALSVVTLAELQVGVLAAQDTTTRATRLATLQATADMEVIPVDEMVAAAWSRLRTRLLETGSRAGVNDLWIAATALARDLPLFTQDSDFDPLQGLDGLNVVRL
jgi:predicted nucleic acid-binding protein